jgi:hypothetical protein
MESTAYQADKIGITKRSADKFNELATSQLSREGCVRVVDLGAFRERKPTGPVGRNAATNEQKTDSRRPAYGLPRQEHSKVLYSVCISSRIRSV